METPAATGQPAVAVVPVPAVFAGFGNSLYVGDLDSNVNGGQLADMFSHVGQVVSVGVCRDQTKRSSLGYTYVNYSNPQDEFSESLQELGAFLLQKTARNDDEESGSEYFF